jgi:hypothetical protein
MKDVKEEIIQYLDEHIEETIDRNELQELIERAIIKTLVQIRIESEDEEP